MTLVSDGPYCPNSSTTFFDGAEFVVRRGYLWAGDTRFDLEQVIAVRWMEAADIERRLPWPWGTIRQASLVLTILGGAVLLSAVFSGSLVPGLIAGISALLAMLLGSLGLVAAQRYGQPVDIQVETYAGVCLVCEDGLKHELWMRSLPKARRLYDRLLKAIDAPTT